MQVDTVTMFAQAFGAVEVCQRSFLCPTTCEVSHLGDGTAVTLDSSGNLVMATYPTGTQVKRNAQSVFVRATAGDFWMCDQAGRWYRLD